MLSFRAVPAAFIFLWLPAQVAAQGIVVPSDTSEYARTVAQLEAGKTGIDYAAFRQAFVNSKSYARKQQRAEEYDKKKQDMRTAARAKDYAGVTRAAQAMLSLDYTSMHAHKYLQQTYKILGDTGASRRYKEIEFGLLRSVLATGDGQSCATAWEVVQVEEEYFILEMKGATLLKQKIDTDGGCATAWKCGWMKRMAERRRCIISVSGRCLPRISGRSKEPAAAAPVPPRPTRPAVKRDTASSLLPL